MLLRPRHLLVTAVAVATASPLVASLPAAATAPAPASQAARVAAPAPGADAPPARPRRDRYRATVRITRHGIPHVRARSFGSLGFGSGWAIANQSICNLADVLLTARGERSLHLGPDGHYSDLVGQRATNLEMDTLVGDLHARRVVERLLASPAGPSRRARTMVRGYVAGINHWLRTRRVTDPACRGAAWIRPGVRPLDVWYGVYLANLVASTAQFVHEIATASPPSPGDPGLPDLGALGLPALPTSSGEVTDAAALVPAEERRALMASFGRGLPFGSNATAIGGERSSTGRGMLLGNPHFPWKGRYRFSQQHLTIPGRYDVAGASLIGSPAVNIGWNRSVAWSHTVSTAYRFTPYEYATTGPGPTYLTPEGPRSAQRREVRVRVRRADGGVRTVTEDVWRTPQGYVIDSPRQLMPWGPQSFWAIRDANAEHLRTIDTFLDMGAARSVRDLLARQDRAGGMPWVNTTAADRHGDVLYADHSVVPHVTDELAQQCMTVVGRLLDTVAGLPGLNGNLADGACAWGSDADAQRPGIFGPANLPAVVRRDWVMNANDSYWTPNDRVRIEGYDHIIGCERCERTMRTRMVSQYVVDRLAAHGRETPRSLRGHQHANRVRAGEVARAGGDLDRVCRATGETEACRILAAWDGRSDAGSVGYVIFQEFVQRAPSDLWEVPFDPADPMNTPRDLRETQPVVDAMAAAIRELRRRGVDLRAPWGEQHVAADRGAPPLPLGGGNGDLAGNANALASRLPEDNTGFHDPVTYGSSHIQAVAFTRRGVRPFTILTYGQYEDPRSRWSSDQTRLFSRERWVRFAWRGRQIDRQLVRVVRLRR